jgi:hypothetical protein
MSFHVYIAYPGLKDEPISGKAWMEAVKSVSETNENLVFCKREAKATAYLRNSTRHRLNLDPYGLIHTQDPNKELVEIMFQIASKLNAGVYSERAKPYESPDDWEKRTEAYRNRKNELRRKHTKTTRIRLVAWLAAIIIGVSMGVVFGNSNAT